MVLSLMRPNVLLAIDVVGYPNETELVRFVASARSSNLCRSRIWNRLSSDISMSQRQGWSNPLRPVLPSAPAAGLLNIAIWLELKNHLYPLALSSKTEPIPELHPLQLAALLTTLENVFWPDQTVKGRGLKMVRNPATSHPPTTWFSAVGMSASSLLCCPTGSS